MIFLGVCLQFFFSSTVTKGTAHLKLLKIWKRNKPNRKESAGSYCNSMPPLHKLKIVAMVLKTYARREQRIYMNVITTQGCGFTLLQQVQENGTIHTRSDELKMKC